LQDEVSRERVEKAALSSSLLEAELSYTAELTLLREKLSKVELESLRLQSELEQAKLSLTHEAPVTPSPSVTMMDISDIHTPQESTAIDIAPPQTPYTGLSTSNISTVSVEALQKSLSEEQKKASILEMQLKDEQDRRMEAQSALSDEQRRVELLEIQVSDSPHMGPGIEDREHEPPEFNLSATWGNLTSPELDWKGKGLLVMQVGGNMLKAGWRNSADSRGRLQVFLLEKKWGTPHWVLVYLLFMHLLMYYFVVLRICQAPASALSVASAHAAAATAPAP